MYRAYYSQGKREIKNLLFLSRLLQRLSLLLARYRLAANWLLPQTPKPSPDPFADLLARRGAPLRCSICAADHFTAAGKLRSAVLVERATGAMPARHLDAAFAAFLVLLERAVDGEVGLAFAFDVIGMVVLYSLVSNGLVH